MILPTPRSSSPNSPAERHGVLFLLAAIAGVAVACIYLQQPILGLLRDELGVSAREAGLLNTSVQLGYAAGLFFLVPLGDYADRRALLSVKLVLLAGAALLAAESRGAASLSAGLLLVGVCASAAQDAVPFATELAPEGGRGRAVGAVMSGLLSGILLSRTVSGFLAGRFGWRAPYRAAAALCLLLAAAVRVGAPSTRGAGEIRLKEMYASMLRDLRDEPRLRLSLLTHGCLGLSFSAFWSMLGLHLSAPPFRMSPGGIGLMGVCGLSGIFAAPWAGRRADRSSPLDGVRVGILLSAAAFAAMAAAPGSRTVIVLGAIVFDFGVQASLISHQYVIYRLDAARLSRINGVFMTSLFLFFALGSLLASVVWRWGRWRGTMALGLAGAAAAYAFARAHRAYALQNPVPR
jgi:predicted MFS family arabinose efflux permease